MRNGVNMLHDVSKAVSRLGARVWCFSTGTNVKVAFQWCPYKNVKMVPGYGHLSAQDFISAMLFTHAI